MMRDRAADRRLLWETMFVLAVSLGQSAWYSILRMIERLTRGVPMNQQTSTLNSSVTPGRPWLDLLYQLSDIAFGVVPALLAVLLLAQVKPPRQGVRRALGLEAPGWGRDVGAGAMLAAIIGIPGLGFYWAAHALGFNTTVRAADLQHVWWTAPVLIGLAGMNAVLEETVMIGYLFTRWGQIGWSTTMVIVTSAI
ncbi:CPBP family intramembrane metalloprotease domain-containing protein, partial [Cutibacterium acnes]